MPDEISVSLLRSKEAEDIFREIQKVPIVDVHTHVPFDHPTVKNAAEITDYHYFGESARAMGVDLTKVTEEVPPQERFRTIASYLPSMVTMAPGLWLKVLSEKFFGFKEFITPENADKFYEAVASKVPLTLDQVFKEANIEVISLTNEPWEQFPDDLDNRLIPTYRVDSLIFCESSIFDKLEEVTGKSIGSLDDYEDVVEDRMQYFLKHGAKSTAASIGPSPQTMEVRRKDAAKMFDKKRAGKKVKQDERTLLSAYMMDLMAAKCGEAKIPMQWMVGTIRHWYAHGYPAGDDLDNPTSELSGMQYLINKHDATTLFPISIFNRTANQQLSFMARQIESVYASGHWWTANTKEGIERDLTERFEIIPHAKMIGQYSDAYTSEFVFSKMWMYRQTLSNVLAERYVQTGILKLDHAIDVAKDVIYNNPKKVFKLGG